MNLQEFRFYYPEYDQIPDDKLADSLYSKYYASKLDRQSFYSKIGVESRLPPGNGQAEPAPQPQTPALNSADQSLLASHEPVPNIKPAPELMQSHSTRYLDKFRDPENSLTVAMELGQQPATDFQQQRPGILDVTGTPADVGRTAIKQGSLAAKSFNEATAGFMGRLDKMADKVSEITGLEKGGLFEKAKEQYLANAEKWNARAGKYGLTDEIIGEIIGGAVPGVMEFALGVPYAAAAEYGETGSIKEAAKAGVERALIGKLLHGINVLKVIPRTVLGGVFGAATTAAEGGTPREIAKGAATMGAFSAMAGKGEKIGIKEAAKDFKAQSPEIFTDKQLSRMREERLLTDEAELDRQIMARQEAGPLEKTSPDAAAGPPARAAEPGKAEVVTDLKQAQQIAEQRLIEWNEGNPQDKLMFNGVQDQTAINRPPLYFFTVTEGEAKGHTFALPEPPTVETIKAKVNEKKSMSRGAQTLRGRIKEMGMINFLNFKGELKNMDTAVKFLSRKDGVPIDLAERTLRDEGWLDANESLLDLLRDKETLKRGKIAGTGAETKTKAQQAQEKKMQAEAEREPEGPPEGTYDFIKAEDLPEGREVHIIDGNGIDGWDVYRVVDKDPFGITLQDGRKIELGPMDKVQVRMEDVKPAVDPTKAKQADIIQEKPSIFDEPQQAVKPKAAPKEKPAESGQEQNEMFGFNQTDMFGKRSKTPTGFASEAGYQTRAPAMMQMPEIVQLAKDVLSGKYPQVRAHISRNEGVAGLFRPQGEGSIKLKAGIFEDPQQAAAVLAHEIGHAVDYLPDKTMKRGNLLGRIASLKRNTERVLPNKPGAPGLLTDADRKRISMEAEKALGQGKLIEEEITRQIPLKPDQILSIWNNVEGDIKKNNPELYKYIAGLDAATKKSIIKEALKGQVPDELKKFSQTITEKTGRVIKAKVTKSDIEKKFNELIKEEIKKRKLFVEGELREELKTWSHFWKPFDAAADKEYTKYRYSGKELYADWFSGLIMAPDTVKRYTPKFYEAFFNYLERKPEVKATYDGIQDMIKAGAVEAERTKNIRQMFRRGDDVWFQQYEKDRSFKDSFYRDFVDANHFLYKKIRAVGEANVPPGDNPRYKIEEMKYTGSEIESYMTDAFRDIVKPLEKAGADWDEFGEYLFHSRVSTERSEMANPLGWTPDLSKKRLAEMEAGKTGDALKEAKKQFRDLHNTVTDKAERAGIWSADLIKLMRDRNNYATFNVTDYLEQKYGRGPGAKVFKQIGTLNEITNPATATIMKDISVIKATNRSIAAKSTVEFLKKHFPDEVPEADTRWVNNRNEYVEPKNTDLTMIQYLDGGKIKAHYVNKFIGESFETNPVEAMAIAKILSTVAKPFRVTFTELNYGFWMFNLHRDYLRTAKNLQGTSALKFIPHYIKGIKPAFKSVFGVPDPVVKEMQKGNMLISIADIRGMVKEDRQLERLLKQYHITPLEFKQKIVRPFGKMFTYFSNVGRAFERVPKVAGYQYLREKFPSMNKEEVAHIVRTQAGSPDFLRAGRAYPIYNNLLLFSNAIKEGYRGDYEAFSKTPGEYLWKTAKYHWIPKAMQYAAASGLLGLGIQQIMDGVSEYDKTNYHIIPLGITPEGKSIYWRVPTDETGRLMGGIFWKMLNSEKLEFSDLATGIFDYMAGQAPTLNPGIDVINDIAEYASGKNPYDSFRGRYAVPENIKEAGGMRSHEYFAKYIANKMGAGIIYKFQSGNIDRVKDELETVLGLPVVNNSLGRFLKVSDYGEREDIRRAKLEVKSQNAADLLDAKDALQKMINGKELTQKDQEALLKKPDIISDRNILIGLSRKYGYLYLEEYMSAQTKEEKAAVVQVFIEKHMKEVKGHGDD